MPRSLLILIVVAVAACGARAQNSALPVRRSDGSSERIEDRAPEALAGRNHIKIWVFNFFLASNGGNVSFGGNFSPPAGRRRVRNGKKGARPPAARAASETDRDSQLAVQRYTASINSDTTPIASADAGSDLNMTGVFWGGYGSIQYTAHRTPDGRLVIDVMPTIDDLAAADAGPVEVDAKSNVVRTSRDDRKMRLRAPNYANVTFVVFDVAGDDEHAWNLDPFETEFNDVDLLRFLLLRFDEDPDVYATMLLELLRLMPATLEMNPAEAQKLLADLGTRAAKKMPADRLRIAVEQAALMAGIEKAVPAEAARWIADDELTCVEFLVYRDLSFWGRLPDAVRAYSLTRTLSHSVDPRYNDGMLAAIDRGVAVFDEKKAPKLLPQLRADRQNRNPATLVPLAAAAIIGLIVTLISGRRIASRILFR